MNSFRIGGLAVLQTPAKWQLLAWHSVWLREVQPQTVPSISDISDILAISLISAILDILWIHIWLKGGSFFSVLGHKGNSLSCKLILV